MVKATGRENGTRAKMSKPAGAGVAKMENGETGRGVKWVNGKMVGPVSE